MLCWYSLLAGTLRKLFYEYVQPARPTTRLHLRYHETFYYVIATYVNRAVGVRVLYEVNSSTAAEESLRRPSESWCMMSVEAAFSGGCGRWRGKSMFTKLPPTSRDVYEEVNAWCGAATSGHACRMRAGGLMVRNRHSSRGVEKMGRGRARAELYLRRPNDEQRNM